MSKVYVVEKSWFANKIVGKNITLYPFIFLMDDAETAEKNHILSHEYIHIQQVRSMGWFKFYISYVWFYIQNRRSGMAPDLAYRAIPYEAEAYKNQYTVTAPVAEFVFK